MKLKFILFFVTIFILSSIVFADVEIDANCDDEATEGTAENICFHSPTGKLHAAYSGGGFDLWYANSTDNTGSTWSKKELLSGSVLNVGIMCYNDDDLMIYYMENVGDDIDYYNSSDNGVTWNGPYTLLDYSASVSNPNCKMGIDKIIQCCMPAGLTPGSRTLLYINNSGGFGSEIVVNDNVADSTDLCNILLDKNNVPYIIAIGQDNDDVVGWSPAWKGWGDNNRITISNGVTLSQADGFNSKLIEIDGTEKIMIGYIDALDLWFCNGTTENGTTFTCNELDPDPSYDPYLGININGETFYTYSGSSGGTGAIYKANSSDMVSWSIRSGIASNNGGYMSIAHQNYPASSQLTDKVHLIYTDDSNTNLYYFNKTIPYSAPLPPNQIENLTNTTQTDTTINITFDYSDTGTTLALIYRNGTNIANNTYPDETYQLTGLTQLTTYNITVNAYSSGGENTSQSAENSIIVTTPAPEDTCTCPLGDNINWIIRDNCTYQSTTCYIPDYNISIGDNARVTMSGSVNWSADNIFLSKIGGKLIFTYSDQIIITG